MRITVKGDFPTAYSQGNMKIQFLGSRYRNCIQVHAPTFYIDHDALFDPKNKCLTRREDTP